MKRGAGSRRRPQFASHRNRSRNHRRNRSHNHTR